MCNVMYYHNQYNIRTGVLGYEDGSVPGALTAVLIVHVVIGLYVYVAWREGSRDLQSTIKSD